MCKQPTTTPPKEKKLSYFLQWISSKYKFTPSTVGKTNLHCFLDSQIDSFIRQDIVRNTMKYK